MLGERIRTLRKRKGYSQEQLARRLHVTQGAVSQWEKNITTPAADQLKSLAEIFEITVDNLLDENIIEEVPKPRNTAPRTTEARILAAGIDRMPEADRKKALDIMCMVFDKYKDYFERADDCGT